MIRDFGFRKLAKERTSLGELIFLKEMRWKDSFGSYSDVLKYNIRYGPASIEWKDAGCLMIPIQPRFHRLLFPEAEIQLPLFPDVHPFGNSIRKAYLSRARLKEMPRGTVLMFYRSEDAQALTAIGIAEDFFISSDAEAIARFVGKRTVYSFDEISAMCGASVLAILFRQARLIDAAVPLAEMLKNKVLKGPPQSIVRVRNKEAIEWLQKRLAL